MATGVGLKICKSGLLRWVCTYETAIDTRAVYLGKKKNIIGIKHHFRKVFIFSGVHVKVGPFVSIALFSNLDTSSSKFGKI